jgi:replicative DNA helicase
MTKNGFENATTDVDVVRKWWVLTPDANIGIATGASQLVVVDIDVKAGIDGFETCKQLFPALLTIATLRASTPSGGQHIFFLAPDGIIIKNSAGKLGLGIDIRAWGGYVLAAPSVLPEVGTYTWLVNPDTGRKGVPLALPGDLLDALTPTPVLRNTSPSTPGPARMSTGTDDYGAGALDSARRELASMSDGRHVALFHHASCMGELVAGGHITRADAEDAMLSACNTNGGLAKRGEKECMRVIRSGIDEGMKRPRHAPETAKVVSVSTQGETTPLAASGGPLQRPPRQAAPAIMPCHPKAEAALLGAILLSPDDVMPMLADVIEPGDFYHEKHRTIFDAMSWLYQHNRQIEIVTVEARLTSLSLLDIAGGASYLDDIAYDVQTWDGYDEYARIIKDASTRRQLITTAEKIKQIAKDGSIEAHEAVEQAESMVYDIRVSKRTEDIVTLQTALDDVQIAVLDMYNNPGTSMGLPTGYWDIDRYTGGLLKAEMTVIAARPGVGKSALGINMAYRMGKAGAATLFVSMEMKNTQQAIRLLSIVENMDSMHLRTGPITDDDLTSMGNGIEKLGKQKIFLTQKRGTVAFIRSLIRRVNIKCPLDVVILDYLQLIKCPPHMAKASEYERLTEVARDVKELCEEMDIPIIAIAQLNRASEGRADKRPTIADLRGTGEIEQAANNIILLHREDKYERRPEDISEEEKRRPVPVEVNIAKQRSGLEIPVYLMYDMQHTAFYEMDTKSMPPPKNNSNGNGKYTEGKATRPWG